MNIEYKEENIIIENEHYTFRIKPQAEACIKFVEDVKKIVLSGLNNTDPKLEFGCCVCYTKLNNDIKATIEFRKEKGTITIGPESCSVKINITQQNLEDLLRAIKIFLYEDLEKSAERQKKILNRLFADIV